MSDMMTLDILIDTRIHPCFVMIENNPDWQDLDSEVKDTLLLMINDKANKYGWDVDMKVYVANRTQYLKEFKSIMAYLEEPDPSNLDDNNNLNHNNMKQDSEDFKYKFIQELTKGNVRIGQLIFDNSGTITYHEHRDHEEEENATLTTSKIGKALEAVQDIMWGQSANAVIFCALRDNHGYADNMSQYERDWKIMAGERRLSCQCPEGTLRAAFRDNPYLKLPVDKWSSNGVPDRAISLIKKFEESIL